MSAIADAVRDRFPVLSHRTYLNSCSYGALCVEVRNAIEEYIETRLEYGSRWDLWVGQLGQVRERLARLLGCPAEDVAVTASVSEALNNLASAFDFTGKRNKVVVTDFDFPTVSQIWLAHQARGARVVRARADASGNDIPLSSFEALIDDSTALVSIPLVCYRNGARLDPGPIIELAHGRGAMVVLDAYQALGTFPVDARALEVDFLVGGCLKYLLGSAGVGFLYERDSAQSALSPATAGWFAQENPDAMDIHHHAPAASARRFETGTPNVCGLHAARAGLDVVLEIGTEAIAGHIGALHRALLGHMDANGWVAATPRDPARRGAMMAIRALDAPAAVTRLGEAGIVVSDRDGNVRVSPHFYNNEADIDRLCETLLANNELLVQRAATTIA